MNNFEKIFALYEKELKIPLSVECDKCDAKHKKPLLPWQIGDNYPSKQGGIFIAGKPHRGKEGEPKNSIKRNNKILDGRIRGKKLFYESNWAYWSYTKDILNSIYETTENSWNNIAFSNIIKCSSTSGYDKTSRKCAEQCITKNQVIFEEIKLLKPKKIIFYTWSLHRDLFDKVPFAQNGAIKEHTDKKHRKKCGKKQLGWWDRSMMATWGGDVDFLITGHPQFMKKAEYIAMVSQWLKKA